MAVEVIKPLHGLRGAAALTVVVGHYGFVEGAAASLGVVLSCILGGLLIARLYLEAPCAGSTVWSYLLARFARVYPLFALVVVGTGGLGFFFPGINVFGLTPPQILRNLMLFGENLTIWTISTEFQFYVFFVLVWFARSRLNSAGAVLYPLLAVSLVIGLAFGDVMGRIGLFGYLHVFAIGMVIAHLARPSPDSGPFRVLLPLLALGYGLVFLYSENFYDAGAIYRDPIALMVCAGLVLATLKGADCWMNRVLSSAPLFFAGEISFGIYLLHRPVARVFDFLVPAFPSLPGLLVKIALTLIASWIAFQVVEKPARKRLREWGGRVGMARRQQRALAE